MTYFTVNGHAPSGAMAGADAIAFDLAGVVAQQLGGSWIVTDGSSRLLDFGDSKADALHAVTIIKRYGFTHQCFVGRPNALMMYSEGKRAPRAHHSQLVRHLHEVAHR